MWTFKQAGPAEVACEKRLYVSAQQRHKNKDGPQTVNHARNSGQQLGRKGKRAAQPAWGHFRHENCHSNGQRHRDHERNNRRNDGSIDERQGTELIVDRIPLAAKEKFEAEGVPREAGLSDQFINNQTHEGQNAQTAGENEAKKAAVSPAAIAAPQQGSGLTARDCNF